MAFSGERPLKDGEGDGKFDMQKPIPRSPIGFTVRYFQGLPRPKRRKEIVREYHGYKWFRLSRKE